MYAGQAQGSVGRGGVDNTSDQRFVAEWLAQSLAATSAFAADTDAAAMLLAMAEAISAALRQGGKLLVAGNGGSAADAQHIAAEFASRMNYDRAPLAALALTTDSSALTAIGNDYGFVHVFERQVQALGRPGDVLLGLSTSGRSPNVVRALQVARERGLATLGFAGAQGGPLAEWCDLLLRAPSDVTPIIQQIHIIAAHIVCSLVERTLCPRRSA
jgi:D-sedoheptulose 7-phosphate isomerase